MAIGPVDNVGVQGTKQQVCARTSDRHILLSGFVPDPVHTQLVNLIDVHWSRSIQPERIDRLRSHTVYIEESPRSSSPYPPFGFLRPTSSNTLSSASLCAVPRCSMIRLILPVGFLNDLHSCCSRGGCHFAQERHLQSSEYRHENSTPESMMTVSVPQHALREDMKASHSCTTILVFNDSARPCPRSPVGALAFLTCDYDLSWVKWLSALPTEFSTG